MEKIPRSRRIIVIYADSEDLTPVDYALDLIFKDLMDLTRPEVMEAG